jgi:hypothetical protein
LLVKSPEQAAGKSSQRWIDTHQWQALQLGLGRK